MKPADRSLLASTGGPVEWIHDRIDALRERVGGRAAIRPVDYATMALLVVAAFALYARTAAPGMLDGDEGEFQTNIFRLGVSHTGYPLFFLLGKLWTILDPIGTIAARENLYAALWGALAAAAVFALVTLLTRNRWAAVLCAALFAVSRVEWSQSIIPRPYTLNSLFVVLVTALFFLWRVGKVDLTAPVFALGLSLTNHRTMIWFAPAIAVLVLAGDYAATFKDDRPVGGPLAVARQWLTRSTLFKPRRLLPLAAAFVLPLLLYGYVFWRGESDVGVEFHFKDFDDMILAGNAGRWMRYGPLDWLVSRVTDLYLPLLVEQFTPLGLIAGLIGMVALVLDRPPRGWPAALPTREAFLFLLLANFGNSLFCVFFWTIDLEKFFIPSFLTFLFFAGVGIATVWDWLSAHIKSAAVLAAQGALALVFVGATAFLVKSNYAVNDFSGRTAAIDAWQENLAQPLEQHAIVVGSWESLTPLEYAMYVDGKRTDLERWKVIVQRDQLGLVPYGSRQEDIERAVRAGRPLYMTLYPRDTETLGALADEFRLTRVGQLWRVIDLPATAAAPTGTMLAAFSDPTGRAVDLLGYTLYPSVALRAGEFALATFFWRAPQELGLHLTMSLRLVDARGKTVVQRDAEPSSGLRPTIGWSSGETVQDDEGFIVPPGAAPGAYHLVLVVYNSASVEDLTTADGNLFTVGEVKVAP